MASGARATRGASATPARRASCAPSAPSAAPGTSVTPGSVAGSPACRAGDRCAAGLECRPSPDGENEVCVSYRRSPAGRCDPLDGTTICSMDTDCAPNTAPTDGVCAAPGAAPGAACQGRSRCDTGLSCSAGQVKGEAAA
ncbi:MAG: hypothetical protein IPN17_20225 [Deltaproteobacteria bacterium]|nr:hypothetical protein [Deltaproteobacteria bacterium]